MLAVADLAIECPRPRGPAGRRVLHGSVSLHARRTHVSAAKSQGQGLRPTNSRASRSVNGSAAPVDAARASTAPGRDERIALTSTL